MVTIKRRQPQAVFKAISDPTRRQILYMLRSGGRTVGNVASNFRTSRPAISKHLRLLRAAGLISTRKHGTTRICELNARPLRAFHDWLLEYQTFWDENLRNLKKFVEENP